MCCHGKYFAVMDTFLTPHYNQSIKPHIQHTHTTYIVIENALAVNTFIHHLSHVTLNVQQNNPIFGLGIIKNTCKSKNRIWHHCVLCLSLKITEITFQELFPFIYVNLQIQEFFSPLWHDRILSVNQIRAQSLKNKWNI